MKKWLLSNKRTIIEVVALIIFFVVLTTRCNSSNSLGGTQIKMEPVTTSVLKDGTAVSSSTVNYVDENTLRRILEQENNRTMSLFKTLHKVDQYSKQVTATVYDSINIPYRDTVPCIFTKRGTYRDTFKSYDYISSNKAFVLKNLTSYDSITRIQGVDRKWFLGRETYTVREIHSNPNVKVLASTSFQVDNKIPWYRSRVAAIVVGVIIGAVIVK